MGLGAITIDERKRQPVWNLERDAYHPTPWSLSSVSAPGRWFISDATGSTVAEVSKRGVALAIVDAINVCADAYFKR